MSGMATIDNIADLVRILKEQPEWTETLRSILLAEELLNLPARFAMLSERFTMLSEQFATLSERFIMLSEQFATLSGQFAEFVQETRENNRVVNIRLAQQEEQTQLLREQVRQLAERTQLLEEQTQQLTERTQLLEEQTRLLGEQTQQLTEQTRILTQRFNRLEGRFSNFEGDSYERKVRNRALIRAQRYLGLEEAHLSMFQDGQMTPALNSAIFQAFRNAVISGDQVNELVETDIIASDPGNRHVVFEVSITAAATDVHRAKSRADILATVTGGTVIPAIITANLHESQRLEAANEEVTAFIIPYP